MLNITHHLQLENCKLKRFHYTPMRGFPGGSVVKNLPANAGYTGSVSGLGRSLGEGNGNQFQYSCLGNPMNREAWRATAHGTARIGHD